MPRITYKWLEKRLERVRDLVPDLYLTSWSPGDGWTRYRLERPAGEGVEGFSPLLSVQGMDAYLSGMIDLASELDRRKRNAA